MGEPRYSEDATSPRAWRVLGLVLLVLVLASGLLGVGSFVDGLLVGLLLAVLLGGVAALTLWSMQRYGRVRLTDDELRVGRHAVPVADVDPQALLVQAAARPELAARWPQAAAVDPATVQVTSKPTVMGGAYAAPAGHRVLLLRTRDGQWRQVPTRRPDALLQALLEVTVRP